MKRTSTTRINAFQTTSNLQTAPLQTMRDTGTTESPLYLLLSRRLFSSCVVVGVAQCCHGLQDVHGTRSDRHNTSFYYFCAPQQAAGKLQRIIRFEVEQGG